MVKILALSGLALILSQVACSDQNGKTVQQQQQQQLQHQSTPRSEDLNDQDQPETILLLEDSAEEDKTESSLKSSKNRDSKNRSSDNGSEAKPTKNKNKQEEETERYTFEYDDSMMKDDLELLKSDKLGEALNNDSDRYQFSEQEVKKMESAVIKPLEGFFEGDIGGIKMVPMKKRSGRNRAALSKKQSNQKKDEKNYVHFFKGMGCYSLIGKNKPKADGQPLSLGMGCVTVGIAIHEMVHAAGFFHEQSRTDRDDHVKVIFENIPPKYHAQFKKHPSNELDTLGLPYDLDSLMHYAAKDFSSNGKETIKAVKGSGKEMGQRKGFSKLDLEKLNKYYECKQEAGDGKGSTAEDTTKPLKLDSTTKAPKAKDAPDSQKKDICEGETANLSCGDKTIQIESAWYGRTSITVCLSLMLKSTSCKKDVTSEVKEKCDGKKTCSFKPGNELFGDPCQFTKKYVHVEFSCK